MPEYDLSGRSAIVTGGGRGIGRAMVEALIEAGADVLAAAHIAEDFPELKAACAGGPGRLETLVANIQDTGDCDRIVAAARDKFGTIDALVNNAGLTFTYIYPGMFRRPEWTEHQRFPMFYEATDEIVQNVITTNFLGADRLARRVAPLMVERGWGRIVNVTTMYNTMTRQGSSPYGASKAALECASEIWSKDLDGTGVTVNILNPGAGAATPGLAQEVIDRGRRGEIPLAEPEMFKAPIVWLLSDATDGINGMRYDAIAWDAGRPAAEVGAETGARAGVLLYSMPEYKG
jgi:3-oxoacyl-[acyl-carrier protein] reductase